MSDIKSQLGNLLNKPAAKVAAPESLKEPVPTVMPEPIPTAREIDKLISTPVQPNCGGCMQAMTKTKQGGWICNPCREKALVMMAGRTPEPVTAEPPTPVEVTQFDTARRKLFADLRAAKASCDALQKLTFNCDDMGKAVANRLELAIFEALVLHPELDKDVELPSGEAIPAEYRLGLSRTPRGSQDAITGYESPSAIATWTGRKS